MFTVREYYSRRILGTFKTRQAAYKAIDEMGMLVHHVKGSIVVAIK